jgi:hypothetical protein
MIRPNIRLFSLEQRQTESSVRNIHIKITMQDNEQVLKLTVIIFRGSCMMQTTVYVCKDLSHVRVTVDAE